MPFNINSFINNVSDNVLNSPTVLSIAKNPIMTSLCITMLTFIVILLIFANANDSILTLAFRAAFWVFVLSCGILFLHNKILLHECEERNSRAEYSNIIDGALDKNNIDRENYVPININTDFVDL